MPQPKVPPDVADYLRERRLTLWACLHPITFNYDAPQGKPPRGRADTSRVQVQIAGPGLDGFSHWGYGRDVRSAVEDAVGNVFFRSKRSCLDGAVARLEMALQGLSLSLVCKTHMMSKGEIRVDSFGNTYLLGDLDDDIPF